MSMKRNLHGANAVKRFGIIFEGMERSPLQAQRKGGRDTW